MENSLSGVLDIAALDKEDQTVLLVEAKAGKVYEEGLQQLSDYFSMLAHPVPFAMLADLDKIQLFKWDGNELSGPILTFATPDVLCEYDAEFERKRIFEHYFSSLLEAWLRDLAYHWKSANPPGTEELKRVGLLDKLEGGTTQQHVRIQGGHLHNVLRQVLQPVRKHY